MTKSSKNQHGSVKLMYEKVANFRVAICNDTEVIHEKPMRPPSLPRRSRVKVSYFHRTLIGHQYYAQSR